MKNLHWLGAILLACSAPAAAQEQIQEPGPIRHDGSGAVFAPQVGGFVRGSAVRFDQAGRNIGATYDLLRDGRRAAITVYIYPLAGPAAAAADRTRACQADMDSVTRIIESQNPSARAVDDAAAPAHGDAAFRHGRVYALTGRFDGSEQEFRTAAFLYCFAGGGWQVKYRVSWSRDFDAVPLIHDFIRNGPWPAAPPATTI